VEEITGRKIVRKYREQPRKADHICYISNLNKLKSHYPDWKITRNLPGILEEMVSAEREQIQGVRAV
jgi:CDP-paratose 2-epimerase